MFEVGKQYVRRELHAEYGGSRQSGIAGSSNYPLVFLFTGDSGSSYGYEDKWDDNGVFLYSGEGQRGDMRFIRGNKAIRDHASDGRALHVFKSLGRGRPVRYEGRFECASWEIRRGPDVDSAERDVIVFHLVPHDSEHVLRAAAHSGTTIVLRQRAIAAAHSGKATSTTRAKAAYYGRAVAVRDYVLSRANGFCEVCGQPAPFRRADGTPYLESHHTRMLSEGGADHPRWVGAICPNCHKEIHHGANGKVLNQSLQDHLVATENEL